MRFRLPFSRKSVRITLDRTGNYVLPGDWRSQASRMVLGQIEPDYQLLGQAVFKLICENSNQSMNFQHERRNLERKIAEQRRELRMLKKSPKRPYLHMMDGTEPDTARTSP